MKELLESFSELKNKLEKLENELIEISSIDYVTVNRKLEEKLQEIQKENEVFKKEVTELQEEKSRLRLNIIMGAYTERTVILNNEIKKIKNMIGSKCDDEVRKVNIIEQETKEKMYEIQKNIKNESEILKNDIGEKLKNMEEEIQETLEIEKEKIIMQKNNLLEKQVSSIENLKNQEFSKEELNYFFNKNNCERLIGLNLINKVGILLIIVGVITLSKYSIAMISDVMKGIIIFIIGGSMLLTGEFLSRKKKTTIFSTGMLAGGIGVIYAGIALSLFVLNILSVEVSIVFYFLVSILGFLLSLKHNSQVILNFALIGGYLPLIIIRKSTIMSYEYLYLFFAGLSVFSLVVSFKKKWIFANCLGLLLNITTSAFLGLILVENNAKIWGYIFALIYIVYSFTIYTLIPVVSNYKLKEKFTKLDVILIAINTFYGLIFTYRIFYLAGWSDFYGALAIIFSIIYVILGKNMEEKFSINESITILFYLTGLTFVALIVPLQFGKMWLTLGWLIEGTIVLSFGLIHKRKEFEKFGIIITSLCFLSFVIFDLGHQKYLFTLKYSAISLGMVYILWMYLKYKEKLSLGIEIFKIITVANTIIYIRYMLIYNPTILKLLEHNFYKVRDILELIWLGIIYLIGYFISTNSKIKDKNMKILSMVIYAVALLHITFLIMLGYIGYLDENIIVTCLKVIIGIWFSTIVLSKLLKNSKLDSSYFPVIMGLYLLLMATRGIVIYLNIEFFSLIITTFILLSSIAMIGIGFIKSYYFLRRTGLILILLGIVKLFVFDFSIITTTNRIISYFALGIALIFVSYIYQYFDKKFTLNIEKENE